MPKFSFIQEDHYRQDYHTSIHTILKSNHRYSYQFQIELSVAQIFYLQLPIYKDNAHFIIVIDSPISENKEKVENR